jgi:hypothetical protein
VAVSVSLLFLKHLMAFSFFVVRCAFFEAAAHCSGIKTMSMITIISDRTKEIIKHRIRYLQLRLGLTDLKLLVFAIPCPAVAVASTAAYRSEGLAYLFRLRCGIFVKTDHIRVACVLFFWSCTGILSFSPLQVAECKLRNVWHAVKQCFKFMLWQ